MMTLQGKRIIAFVEDDFEDLELWVPVMRLREEGAEVFCARPCTPALVRRCSRHDTCSWRKAAGVRQGHVLLLVGLHTRGRRIHQSGLQHVSDS